MRTLPSLLLGSIPAALLAAPAPAQVGTKHPSDLCAPSIRDAAQVLGCIEASSVPLAGTLLPLGPEFFVAPTGEVGIGTMAPEQALDVAGNVRGERCAFGNEGQIGPGSSGQWDWLFDFSHRIEDFSTGNPNWSGWSSWFTVDPDQHLVGPNETWIYAHDEYVTTPPESDKDVYFLLGNLMWAEHQGSGQVDFLGGTDAAAFSRGGSVLEQVGAYVSSTASGSAAVGDSTAAVFQSGHSGFGSIENDFGIRIRSPWASGAITNHYGLYLEDQAFGAQDSYAIYSAGGKSYLAGDLGIGTDTPGAKLDVAGDFVASGTKSFVEPHPLDPRKEIRFVCLEGNEAGTYFRGTGRLSRGVARIPVPEEFALVTEPEGLTVQVTPLGPGGELWIAQRDLGWIEVRGALDVDFDYFVNGVRRGYADFAVVRDRAPRTSNASASERDPGRDPRATLRAAGPRGARR